MAYRTKTYIAGDWDGDRSLIDQLDKWNESDRWGLSFSDAHKMTQARDSSLPCSIKSSLRERLEVSKTFVLVVGNRTSALTKGACRHCSSYSSAYGCARGHSVSHRSFVDYECDYAAKNNLRVVVLYNFSEVRREKCPEPVRYRGTHRAAYFYTCDGGCYWDYRAIRDAIEGR